MLVHVGILKTWSRNCTVQAAAFTMETLHAFHPWRWAPRTCLSADSSATTAKVHGEDPTVMSGVLMAHEQASNWPAAPSGQASHVSTRPEALAGWLPSQNTTPKQYQYQRERAKRERERGGEKACGKQGHVMFHCSPSKLMSNICRFLPWIPLCKFKNPDIATNFLGMYGGALSSYRLMLKPFKSQSPGRTAEKKQ